MALTGLQPLGLEEYDAPAAQRPAQAHEQAEDEPRDAAAAATQMEEDLGVEDLGAADALARVRKPLPKLDAKRLLNPHRGYPLLLKHLKRIPYRGKGDEKRYLKKYVNTHLIWANRVWPKANFDDFTVLARRAGRDPQVRQYCRDLIEEEKYGTAPAEQTGPQPPEAASPLPRTTDSPHAQTTDSPHANDSGSPPDFAGADFAPPDFAPPDFAPPDFAPPDSAPAASGPNEDEEAAALELYGDLDL